MSGKSNVDKEYQVMRCISLGKRTLRSLRLKVGGLLFVWGLLLSAIYEVCVYIQGGRFKTYNCGLEVADHFLSFAIQFTLCGRLVCLGLVPLAGDIRMTRLVLVSDVIVVALVLIQLMPGMRQKEQHIYDRNSDLYHICSLSIDLICLIYAMLTIYAMFITDGCKMQRFMWQTLSCCTAAMLLPKVVQSIDLTVHCKTFSAVWWCLPAYSFCFYVSVRPRFRESLHATLNRTFERHSAYRGAAGIAGLVGECNTKDVFSEALQRFRAVRIADLKYEDIADKRPDPDLSSKAFLVKMDECDAFVSHSWHDNSRAKWQALQRWRADFLKAHGREPCVWFDKICIDQNNIDADLRCLPIFLSGCKKLLVLCGPSYLGRLWCVVELFTYVHIGRSVLDIDFVHVRHRSNLPSGASDSNPNQLRSASNADEPELGDSWTPNLESASVWDDFASFDVRRCECLKATDKDRMLCIIKAAFGSLEAFNESIQHTFGNALWRTVSVRTSSRHCTRTHSHSMTSRSPSESSTEEAVSPGGALVGVLYSTHFANRGDIMGPC